MIVVRVTRDSEGLQQLTQSGALYDVASVEDSSGAEVISTDEQLDLLLPFDRNTYRNIFHDRGGKFLWFTPDVGIPEVGYRITSMSQTTRNRRRWLRVRLENIQ